jgi:hypothetical protein
MFAAELFSFIMQHTGEMMEHLRPFCGCGVWISIDAHALDLYFKLQKMARAVGDVIPTVICNSQVHHFLS